MTSATEELRRLLDRRGVEYQAIGKRLTYWNRDGSSNNCDDADFVAEEQNSSLTVEGLTPEQAIAATLGSGTCKNKATNSRTFWCECCDCALEDWIDVGGKLINGLRYCPNCGRRVIDDRQGE